MTTVILHLQFTAGCKLIKYLNKYINKQQNDVNIEDFLTGLWTNTILELGIVI